MCGAVPSVICRTRLAPDMYKREKQHASALEMDSDGRERFLVNYPQNVLSFLVCISKQQAFLNSMWSFFFIKKSYERQRWKFITPKEYTVFLYISMAVTSAGAGPTWKHMTSLQPFLHSSRNGITNHITSAVNIHEGAMQLSLTKTKIKTKEITFSLTLTLTYSLTKITIYN